MIPATGQCYILDWHSEQHVAAGSSHSLNSPQCPGALWEINVMARVSCPALLCHRSQGSLTEEMTHQNTLCPRQICLVSGNVCSKCCTVNFAVLVFTRLFLAAYSAPTFDLNFHMKGHVTWAEKERKLHNKPTPVRILQPFANTQSDTPAPQLQILIGTMISLLALEAEDA